MKRLSRPVLVAAVSVVQLGLVGVGVAEPLSARFFGTEVVLRVAPADSLEPVPGSYVDLSYPDLERLMPDPDGSGRIDPPAAPRGRGVGGDLDDQDATGHAEVPGV